MVYTTTTDRSTLTLGRQKQQQQQGGDRNTMRESGSEASVCRTLRGPPMYNTIKRTKANSTKAR